MGFDGPFVQVRSFLEKLPIKLMDDDTWGKKLKEKKINLDGFYYTKDDIGTSHISLYGKDIGKLGLEKQGFGSPTKQVNKLIEKIPTQFLTKN